MEQLSSEKIAQLKDIIKDIELNTDNQSLIKDNKLIFLFDKVMYRCKMPNQRIQAEAETEQNREKISMYKRDDTITKKQLIKVLKEKQDIDIVELESKREKIKQKLNDVYIDLAMTATDEENKLKELKEKKEKIEEDFMTVIIEITEWLSPCIEEQVKLVFYGYLAYACTEKMIDREKDTWEKVWKSYDEYKNDETGLGLKALQGIQSLLINISEQ